MKDPTKTLMRDDSWLRRKEYNEKWPRFCAEVPPELAAELDRHARNFPHGRLTRASMVQAALRMYLEHQVPEPPWPEPHIDGTAEALPDLPQLSSGD